MPIKRYNLSNILLYATIAVCLYLIQRIACFDFPDASIPYLYSRELHYFEYIIVLVGILALSAWYFLIEWKRKALSFHWPLIGLLSVLFIISIVSIFLVPDSLKLFVTVGKPDNHVVKEILIKTSIEQRFLYVLVSFATLYVVYLLLYVLPRKIRFTRQLDWIMYIVIIFAIATMIYSYTTEIDKYKEFFESLTDDTQKIRAEIGSIFNNKNVFGFWMIFGCFACLYLYHSNNRWWFFPFAFVFYFQVILLFAKTSVITCTLVLAIYLIGMLVVRFRKHLISSIIISAAILTVALTIFHFFAIHHYDNNFMADIFKVIDKFKEIYSIDNIVHYEDVSGRDHQYIIFEELLNGSQWAIGMGFGAFNYYYMAAVALSGIPTMSAWDGNTIMHLQYKGLSLSDSPHNAYYQIIGSSGIVGLVVFGLFMLYVLWAAIMNFKKHKLTSLLCLSIIAGVSVGALAEGMNFIFMGPVYINSLFLSLIAIVPVLSNYHHDRHPSENVKYLKDCNQKVAKLSKIKKDSLITKSLYFFLTPALIICCGVLPLLFGIEKIWVLILLIVIGSIYLVVPPVIQLIFYRKVKYYSFILNTALPYHALASNMLGFLYLYSLVIGNGGVVTAGLTAILVFIFYFMTFSISSFYRSQTGIIEWLLDLVCTRLFKRHKRQIILNKKKDSKTLQEKFFGLFIPKRFRKV